MIESSNTQDPVESTGAEAASAAERTLETQETANPLAPSPDKPAAAPEKELTIQEKILALKKPAEKSDAPVDPEKPDAVAAPEVPAFTPNLKYKAFGKEKEIEEFWRPLIKDADSEKKVKELFTRADAFEDVKSRADSAAVEHQKTLQQFTALDRDVRRVTKFLNNGDLDNFFASVRLSDDMLLQHLQRKAELAKLSPIQQQQYQRDVNTRAESLLQQEQYDELQNNYASTTVQARTMALDMVMMRPEIQSVASAWDSKMGMGSFRNLIVQEGASQWHATKKDLPPEEVVGLVLQKFGKLVETAPQAQAPQQQVAQPVVPQAPQAQAPVVVQGKPVIPSINGRGTSPVKQAPKSLDDLRRLGKEKLQQERDAYESASF